MIAAIFLWPPLPGPSSGPKAAAMRSSSTGTEGIGSGPLLNSQTGLRARADSCRSTNAVASFSQLPMYTPLPITWASKPPGSG